MNVGDVDKDGYRDIAIAHPGADSNRGRIHVYSGKDHRSLTGGGLPGTAPGDRFGESLCSTDLNQDGHADLVLGAPGFGSGRGSVWVLYGHDRRAWRLWTGTKKALGFPLAAVVENEAQMASTLPLPSASTPPTLGIASVNEMSSALNSRKRGERGSGIAAASTRATRDTRDTTCCPGVIATSHTSSPAAVERGRSSALRIGVSPIRLGS